MIKRRILKLAVTVIIVPGSGSGLAVLGSGTALASPRAAAQAHVKGSYIGASARCYYSNIGVDPLWHTEQAIRILFLTRVLWRHYL